LEESPAKIAPDGTKRKGSVHVRQRASVKERLSSWPVQSLKPVGMQSQKEQKENI